MTMKKRLDIRGFRPYLMSFLAAILLAFNYQLFIVENHFAPAGINGVATMIQYKTGFSIGYISLMINIPLCILSYFLIDRELAKHSLIFCLTYSFVYLYLQRLGLETFQYDAHGQDTIFPALLSGVISGVVYSICFSNDSSTGGTDLLSKYIGKKRPELNFFWITFTLNAAVAVSSFFVYAQKTAAGTVYDYKPVCLCIVYCFVSSYMGNFIVRGAKSAIRFTVITPHAEALTQRILTELKHSATKVPAVGVFSGQAQEMVICIINRHQLADFQKLLQQYDNTFAFSETVSDTYGNFKRIR